MMNKIYDILEFYMKILKEYRDIVSAEVEHALEEEERLCVLCLFEFHESKADKRYINKLTLLREEIHRQYHADARVFDKIGKLCNIETSSSEMYNVEQCTMMQVILEEFSQGFSQNAKNIAEIIECFRSETEVERRNYWIQLENALVKYKECAWEMSAICLLRGGDLKAIKQMLLVTSEGTITHSFSETPVSCSRKAMDCCSIVEQIDKIEEKQRDGANKHKSKFFPLFKCKKKNSVNGDKGDIVPPPQIDSVQFSAVAPEKAVLGKYLSISIVMYEENFRKNVEEIIRSCSDKAKESKSGHHDVEHNSLIKVVLSSPDVKIEDEIEEKRWNGRYIHFEFVVKIPADFSEEQILFSAAVYVNDIIATKLKLILDCEGKPKRNMKVTRTDIVSAFVSYASQDRNRVASLIQGMKKARPDLDIFFDIESLRRGQKWEEILKTEIDSRDILFLCWSRFARDSKWVDMEWRYALENKGEDYIEPIPIDSPDICPPPAELQQKHFNDKMLYIIKSTMPIERACPCLIRIKTKEYLPIEKPIVHIGKERNYVDLFIGDNAAISRCHASIVSHDGKYYIIDKNSVNHTYVDEKMIPSNVETLIDFGTKIRLANEEFEFVCRTDG